MTDIEQLARRKVELQGNLTAIQQSNCFGKTLDELAEVEMCRIKAQKELHSVIAKITDYEKLEE